MKRLKIIILVLGLLLILVAWKQINSTTPKLVCEDFSTKETYLLNLTGNKVLMYRFNNLPKDKNYAIELSYEVYNRDELVKEERIAMLPKASNLIEIVGLGIKENKINYMLGKDSYYVNGVCEVQGTAIGEFQASLANNINLELGTEIYIYHANDESPTESIVNLGVPIIENEVKQILKQNKTNVLIKLSFKEI